MGMGMGAVMSQPVLKIRAITLRFDFDGLSTDEEVQTALLVYVSECVSD